MRKDNEIKERSQEKILVAHRNHHRIGSLTPKRSFHSSKNQYSFSATNYCLKLLQQKMLPCQINTIQKGPYD